MAHCSGTTRVVLVLAVLVHLIADFGVNDLAFAEVTQAVMTHLPAAQVVATSVGPFDTLAAGFVAAQLAAAPAPAGATMLLNVAPRRDDTRPRLDNDGERLLVAEMPSGFTVLGVDAGYSFSFLAEGARRLWAAEWPTKGSQFRSRDVFPEALALLQAGRLGARPGAEVSVPAVPAACVAYVDGFGNVKTTVRWDGELARHEGAEVEVTVGAVTRTARVAGGSFAVAEGELAVAPGSSGYPLPTREVGAAADERVRWVELFLRGGNAARALGLVPRAGEGGTRGEGRGDVGGEATGHASASGTTVSLSLPNTE